MKTINQFSEKGRNYIKRFFNESYTELYQVYKTYSRAKALAMLDCKTDCYEEGGDYVRIISWNQMQFTVAWRVGNDIRIRTAGNDYIIKNVFRNI